MNNTVNYSKTEKRAKALEIVRKIFVYLLLSVWGIIVLFPFYWMVLTSVKSYSAYSSEHIPKFFTTSPTLKNYLDAFTEVPLAK